MAQAEFYWTLAEPPEAKRIDANGMFSIHMERAFQQGFPMTLSEKDLPVLNGMAATWADVSISPYMLLTRAIHKYKKIVVYMKQSDFIESRAEEKYLETGKRPGE